MVRRCENLTVLPEFDELARAFLDPEKALMIGDTSCLSQILGHDHHGVVSAEPPDEVLDQARGNRVERAARLEYTRRVLNI